MRVVWRIALSVVVAAVAIAAGSAALFVTSAPKWISILVEPFSLVLTPGVAISMIFTKAHDYTQWEILRGAFGFYVVLLYGLLWWLGVPRSLARRQSRTTR